jgi:hypothetical protein
MMDGCMRTTRMDDRKRRKLVKQNNFKQRYYALRSSNCSTIMQPLFDEQKDAKERERRRRRMRRGLSDEDDTIITETNVDNDEDNLVSECRSLVIINSCSPLD